MKGDILFGSVNLDLIKCRKMHCMEHLAAEESVVLTDYGRFSLTLYKNITVNLHMIGV